MADGPGTFRSSIRFRIGAIGTLVVGVVVALHLAGILDPWIVKIRGGSTVDERVGEFASTAAARLRPAFESAGVAYPPREIELAAFKAERRLDLFARDRRGELRFIKSYPILGASGVGGPKLNEGDRQVPEGLYQIDRLNPNSSYHLSLHVNYPNAFDLEQARRDGRTNPGRDIFIHGGRSSIGCMAIGDDAIEELFVLVAMMDGASVPIVISPVDFRVTADAEIPDGCPAWTRSLYAEIRQRVMPLPLSE